MTPLKGLILAGGRGTRLRPLTFTRAKQLIPIANKPNLFYVVEDLLAANITDIGIIISPETGSEVQAALAQQTYQAQFTFITQAAPLGLAHAIQTAREFLGFHPFVMYLGDNLLSGGITFLVDHYQAQALTSDPTAAILLLTEVDHPQQFGVVVLDTTGQVVRLIEKPQDPPSHLVLVGVYLFTPDIHEIIAELLPSHRGEYEITDAIQGLIDQGQKVIAYHVQGWWKDTGRSEDLLEANRLVLSQMQRSLQGSITDSQIVGNVVIESGATIIRSVIRGPAHIAAGTHIEDSYIGPYTSIGSDVIIVQSEIEYSVLMNGSILSHLPYRIDASVIGQGVSVKQMHTRKHTIQLVLGDYSQVEL